MPLVEMQMFKVAAETTEKNSIALKSEESSFRRKEKKNLSKAFHVQMQESDDSNNSDGSIDDEVALMSRNEYGGNPRA
ncbi:hypothetical protein JHK85_024799 [Glycine max]|nr:hypothetical protein JHK85_024799 [Glycine max]